jgi:uncharacterized protein YegP (UPF0339 family)
VPAKVLLQKNNRTGKFRFSLLSARGQVIAASEPYDSKRGAIAALNAFRKNAADAILVDETEPKVAPAKKTAAKTTRTRAAAAVEGNSRRATKRTTTRVAAKKTAAQKTTVTKTAARRPRKTAMAPVAPVSTPETTEV